MEPPSSLWMDVVCEARSAGERRDPPAPNRSNLLADSALENALLTRGSSLISLAAQSAHSTAIVTLSDTEDDHTEILMNMWNGGMPSCSIKDMARTIFYPELLPEPTVKFASQKRIRTYTPSRNTKALFYSEQELSIMEQGVHFAETHQEIRIESQIVEECWYSRAEIRAMIDEYEAQVMKYEEEIEFLAFVHERSQKQLQKEW